MDSLSNKKGLTLIEAIVSIFIVAFMVVGMVRLYSLGAIQSVLAKHKVMAANIAQAEIENLRNNTYEGITLADYPVTQMVKIDLGETTDAADDINGAMVTQVQPVSEGYKLIVTVSWNDYYGVVNEVMESTITSYL